MTNAEIEKAKELKHKLDVAWKQVFSVGHELELMGFDVRLIPCKDNGLVETIYPQSCEKPSVIVKRTEVIEL